MLCIYRTWRIANPFTLRISFVSLTSCCFTLEFLLLRSVAISTAFLDIYTAST